MLVLTRRVDDIINIGDDINIKIVEIIGKRVRIGIEAPKDRRILRGELRNKLNKENESYTEKFQ